MRKYVNGSDVPLSLAVFLAHDGYDYEPGTVSATKLIKPIRQLILGGRVPVEDQVTDVSDLLKSRMGSAIHDKIEYVWKNHKDQALDALGYPKKVIKKIRVNPKPETVKDDEIPVYLEKRSYKTINGYKLSGKFDFVAEGRVEDFKFTSTFTYTNGTKDKDYCLQGSIYRWLNPEIVTEDEMTIVMSFWDFMPARAKTDPKYPPNSVVRKRIPLMSLEATDQFVRQKLAQIDRYKDAPESEIPRCTDEDLWRSEPKWKYYKNPQKMGRATKNFDSREAAYKRLADDGGVGTVIEQPGEVKACLYCPAFSVCTQKDDLIASGELKL